MQKTEQEGLLQISNKLIAGLLLFHFQSDRMDKKSPEKGGLGCRELQSYVRVIDNRRKISRGYW